MRKFLEKLGGIGTKVPEYEPETPEALCEHGYYDTENCGCCKRQKLDDIRSNWQRRQASKAEIYESVNMVLEDAVDKAYDDGYNAGVSIVNGGTVTLDTNEMSSAAQKSYHMGVVDAFGDLNYDPESEILEF